MIRGVGAIDWNRTAQAVNTISQGIQTVSTAVQPFVNKPVSTQQSYAVQQYLQPQNTPNPGNTSNDNNTLLYVGLGVGALAIGGVIFFLATRNTKK